MSEHAKGSELLRKFLDDNNITLKDAGEALGVSAPTIIGWLANRMLPKGARREAIAVWTSGAVPMESWATDTEQKILSKVRPYEPVSSPALPDAGDDDDAAAPAPPESGADVSPKRNAAGDAA